ncbi:cbb3-type cytochrome c oxidase N-terminal domain-containing protein [Patiriisocius marinus]|uniref:Cytochrome c oxidase subunit III n=1 Tax=Patiriisocius marinus TaxID=1397112 RepID=A0A5J4J0Q2_9FLAO|nr:cbb3-type cytochrome c oxidase N-terminal domain-containing protein [Patiriisocius marinus]GER58097.1 cytochrome c oxidase subunit III [Patiriisocius marinus]
MKTTASYLRIIGLFVIITALMEWVYETGAEWAMFTEPYFWGIVGILMLFAISFEVCLEALKTILFKTLTEEQQATYVANELKEKEGQFKWIKEKYKASLGSKSIEEEHEIVLDHNYDGIKELDNNLPPWWVYMFYATIIFAVVYLVRFEVFKEYNQADEYELAVTEAKAEIAEWKKTAKNLVDVNTVELLTEASDLKTGQAIFQSNCVACHKADGGGGIGPNLTDNHWILGGGIKNVFNTISEGGRDGKGMVSWKSDLKPLEMAQVASYVLSFQGTTPADPKDPEGDIWVDPNAPKAEGTQVDKVQDSISVETNVKALKDHLTASN